MSFSFNFLEETDAITTINCTVSEDAQLSATCGDDCHGKKEGLSFSWIPTDLVKAVVTATLKENPEIGDQTSEVLRLYEQEDPISLSSSSSVIRRIREEMVSKESVANYQRTDLVPGIYEGGLKVWECSIDLCRYLYKNNVSVKGHVLELGCGHALPSCWVLKRSLQGDGDCRVVCSDYNDFVLRDITMRNVVLNATEIKTVSESFTESFLSEWLTEHVAFGAGDWSEMSDVLLHPQQDASSSPPAVPNDGLFDFIVAAETTYSEKAAVETAAMIARHLRRKTGVAYVATKRYYFGVRGGTSCLLDALKKNALRSFDVQILQVYDNGVGNIRELLSIKDA